MKKALLLNQSYQELNFVTFRQVVRYIANEKVNVLSYWPETFKTGENEMNYPAIIVLKYPVKQYFNESKYHKSRVFYRDNNTCQYCFKKLSKNKLTIDHVIPRHLGGKTTWLNCVTCCNPCNNYKGNLTLEAAGMRLLNEPYVPRYSLWSKFESIIEKHPDWEMYVRR
jgi:hypothetical protein